MSRISGPSWVAVMIAAILGGLSLVAWRQPRALELRARLEAVGHDLELERAREAELESRIQHLRSRSRVVPEAERRLGMRMPTAEEVVPLLEVR